ncbi:MAG: ABC transporter substrate-binding protein [Candidatus Bathyarchaeota archaeon]|nr:ABC transporter substrate-binding protein [Candidatus Bathyarchaeota archaeon]
MNKKFVLLVLASVLLLWGSVPVGSAQDIPRPYHMIVASIGEPDSVDPAWAYDTASSELIFNVYETLTFYDRESVDRFVPMLATEWHVSEDGLTYIFRIRQDVEFHNDEILTTEDVEYSFERAMVHDTLTSPVWMIYEALLGCQHANISDPDWGAKIDNAVQHNSTHVWFNLIKPYAPFQTILCQSCSSIVNKKFCAEHGDWPGTWDNWQDYHDPEARYSPLDSPEPALCGTGPYKFDYWQEGVEWSIVKNDDYWAGWPAPGCKGYVSRATVKKVHEWSLTYDGFTAGDYDMIYVPRQYIEQLEEAPGIRCVKELPALSCYAIFFTFDINTTSPYMGVPGGLPPGTINETGIPPDFFNDTDIRKGFAYSFNWTRFVEDERNYGGEAIQPATVVIEGLPYRNPDQEKYHLDLTEAEACFKRAWSGEVWEKGFTMTLVYNVGSVPRYTWIEAFKSNVEAINPKFHINMKEVDFSTYLTHLVHMESPMFYLGWLFDYPDPHDFVMSFMHSSGVFTSWQSYSNATVDALIEEGLRTINGSRRREIYYELQRIYHDDCPSVPTAQPLGRHWERDWVQGWYYNPAYPGIYFYHLWKQSAVDGDINNDGIVNIEDIAIIAKAFGSYPGHPRWNEIADIDKNGVINILDLAKVAKNFGKKLESPTASCRQHGLEFSMTIKNTRIRIGDTVEVTLTLTNISNESVTIWFGSGQSFDLYLYQSGLPAARWSDDKAFFQWVWDVKLEGGESFSETLQWNFYTYDSNGYTPPSPGEYELVTVCMGMVGDLNINVMPGMQIELYL